MVKSSRRLSCAIALGSIASACVSTSPPIVSKPIPVIVERDVYVSLPPDLLQACSGRPPALSEGLLNGDLLWIAIGLERSYVPCLEGKLESIRRLQPK